MSELQQLDARIDAWEAKHSNSVVSDFELRQYERMMARATELAEQERAGCERGL